MPTELAVLGTNEERELFTEVTSHYNMAEEDLAARLSDFDTADEKPKKKQPQKPKTKPKPKPKANKKTTEGSKPRKTATTKKPPTKRGTSKKPKKELSDEEDSE